LLQKGFENKAWDSFHSICKRNENGDPEWVPVDDFDVSKNVRCVKVEFTKENQFIQGWFCD
jgi:hypothetical protein